MMSFVMAINGPVAIAGSIFSLSRVIGTNVPKIEANMTTANKLMAELDAKREASGKKAAASVALDSAKEPEDETSEPEETSEAKTDAPEENDK